MSFSIHAFLPNEHATLSLGGIMAQVFLSEIINLKEARALCINLAGDLGAGKTTFTRGTLNALGYIGKVKSPTYTIVESYELNLNAAALLSPELREPNTSEEASAVTRPNLPQPLILYHFDLYRLRDSEELEFMGIRDYFAHRNLCFIEWSERGAGLLPEPDYTLKLEHQDEGRNLTLECLNSSPEIEAYLLKSLQPFQA